MAEEDDMMRDMMGRIQNLEDAIADLKADKEEMSVEEPVKEEVELSTETVETPEPIKHSPEVKEEGFKMDKKNYPNTLMNRIYSKLN